MPGVLPVLLYGEVSVAPAVSVLATWMLSLVSAVKATTLFITKKKKHN